VPAGARDEERPHQAALPVSMLFDTHCHLTDQAFRGDLGGVLERAHAAGVERIVCVASEVGDATDALARVADGERIWSTAGIHPHEAARAQPDDWARLRDLLADPRVVAVGECGLDFHYDHSPRDVQRSVLDRQVELAAETHLPLVVHSRSADSDTKAVLEGLPAGVRGVLHCFTGSPELLDVALERGWMISVTGLVSFRRFDGEGWLRSVPDDRLMVETDAPYMSPEPYRGKRNEPAWVAHVADAVARHRGEPTARVREYTTANALRFFGLDRKSS
jgi:TatD DNase family protein